MSKITDNIYHYENGGMDLNMYITRISRGGTVTVEDIARAKIQKQNDDARRHYTATGAKIIAELQELGIGEIAAAILAAEYVKSPEMKKRAITQANIDKEIEKIKDNENTAVDLHRYNQSNPMYR